MKFVRVAKIEIKKFINDFDYNGFQEEQVRIIFAKIEKQKESTNFWVLGEVKLKYKPKVTSKNKIVVNNKGALQNPLI